MYIPPDNDDKGRINRHAPVRKEQTDMRAAEDSAADIMLKQMTYRNIPEKAFRTLVGKLGAGLDVVSPNIACRSSSSSVIVLPLCLAMCSKTCRNIQLSPATIL
jgi:hypothetical protein